MNWAPPAAAARPEGAALNRRSPRQADFDLLDWEMLMQEWNRTETRLAPPDEPTVDDIA